jgi:hypothetical protein
MKQIKLTNNPLKRQLATMERLPTKPQKPQRPYAKKRRLEKLHVKDKPLAQLQTAQAKAKETLRTLKEAPLSILKETLIGSIERNYTIKAIDSWQEQNPRPTTVSGEAKPSPSHQSHGDATTVSGESKTVPLPSIMKRGEHT